MPKTSGHLKIIATSFHSWIVLAAIVFLLFTAIGSHLAHMAMPGAPALLVGFGAILAVALALVAVLHDRGYEAACEGLILTLESWAIYATISPAVPLICHMGFRIPLMDPYLAQIDSSLGVYIPAIALWSKSHWLGRVAISSYGLARQYVVFSFFFPILLRRFQVARTFLAANLVAGVISLPCMYIAPAVGPWFAYHSPATQGQFVLQAALFSLRHPGPSVLGLTGILCIPSFHVIWAILCGYSLWHIRALRIPAAIFSALLIFSTLATGWHYLVDVIAGAFVALASIQLATAFVRFTDRSTQPEAEPETAVSLRLA